VRRLLPLLLLLGAAACGGGGAQTTTVSAPQVPRGLAQDWAQRSEAVASAVGAGDGCRAQQLAGSLRDDVIAAQGRVPARLRTTLLSSVNRLADEITCTPPVQTVTQQASKPKPKPRHEPKPPKHDHGHKGHGH
jgi:hypothetical protein